LNIANIMPKVDFEVQEKKKKQYAFISVNKIICNSWQNFSKLLILSSYLS